MEATDMNSADFTNGPERDALLAAYLDGALEPDAARAVAEWLDEHPDELRRIEQHRRVWDLLAQYEDETPAEGFSAEVLEACGVAPSLARSAPVLRLAWYQHPVAVAAAFLLAIGGITFALARGGGGAEGPVTPSSEIALGGSDGTPAVPSQPPVTRSLDQLDDAYLADGLEILADLDADQLEATLGELLGS